MELRQKDRQRKRRFESACERAGGDFSEHDSERRGGSDMKFLDCSFGQKTVKDPSESEGEYRSVQLRIQTGEERTDRYDVKPGATVNVRGRATATIENPERFHVEHPNKLAKKSAEEVGVPARKKLKVEGEEGNLTVNGEPAR